jgi:hypothetical protein
MDDTRIAKGEVPTGSGRTAYYNLDLNSPVNPEDEGRYTFGINVGDIEDIYRMKVVASDSEQTAVFDLTTQKPDGSRSPDFYARQFVEWSLDTLAREGVDIQHIDTEWAGGSMNLAQFQEALEGDETKLLEAIAATWSGTTFPELGFTEIELVNIDPPDQKNRMDETIFVRFSKPGSAETGVPPIERKGLDDEPDAAVSAFEDSAPALVEQRQAEIREYLATHLDPDTMH